MNWDKPETYRDIHAGEGFQDSYQDSVFRNLTKHFKMLGEKLPSEHLLKINVSNLDLAGDVYNADIDLTRVIENRTPPQIAFYYEYIDENKKTILAEQVSYRDSGFLVRSSMRYRGHYLRYEKSLLDRWFAKELRPKISAFNKLSQ